MRLCWKKLFGLAGLAGACLTMTTLSALGSNVTLAWGPSASSGIAGYNVYYGGKSRTYTNEMDVGTAMTMTISNLTPGLTYYFAVTCYDSFGNESAYSNEMAATVPATQPVLKIAVSHNKQIMLTVTGPAGVTYNVLASLSPGSWTQIGTATANTNGLMQFVDPAGASHPRCLYKLQSEPLRLGTGSGRPGGAFAGPP